MLALLLSRYLYSSNASTHFQDVPMHIFMLFIFIDVHAMEPNASVSIPSRPRAEWLRLRQQRQPRSLRRSPRTQWEFWKRTCLRLPRHTHDGYDIGVQDLMMHLSRFNSHVYSIDAIILSHILCSDRQRFMVSSTVRALNNRSCNASHRLIPQSAPPLSLSPDSSSGRQTVHMEEEEFCRATNIGA